MQSGTQKGACIRQEKLKNFNTGAEPDISFPLGPFPPRHASHFPDITLIPLDIL
ncbi:MAG TPA: hypothetical protein VMD58_01400 [Acidobacteriaceae bacterium]|nr:hypothetical protein [Acidobacteriaceae bacterium]